MKIVQILGPSYCGSTALGYVLNTAPGWFFGSEVRRLLQSFRKKSSTSVSSCDCCGAKCKYWGSELLSLIDENGIDDLCSLYDIFHEFNPSVEVFIDSSKLLSSYEGTHAWRRIIAVKHPIRMVASYLYNSRNALGLKEMNYDAFSRELSAEAAWTERTISSYIKALKKCYRGMFAFSPQAFLFQTDCAHLCEFWGFKELQSFLELKRGTLRPENFSETPCHSIGGNRAPVWISSWGKASQAEKNPRKSFYFNADGFGDWKVDNKYKLILPEEIIEVATGLSVFKELCDQLGYSELPGDQ